MPAAKTIKKIPLTSIRMADAEGTVGGPPCKGKSRPDAACLDRQSESGYLLIQTAAQDDRFPTRYRVWGRKVEPAALGGMRHWGEAFGSQRLRAGDYLP